MESNSDSKPDPEEPGRPLRDLQSEKVLSPESGWHKSTDELNKAFNKWGKMAQVQSHCDLNKLRLVIRCTREEYPSINRRNEPKKTPNLFAECLIYWQQQSILNLLK
jgi:hypothetical protein